MTPRHATRGRSLPVTIVYICHISHIQCRVTHASQVTLRLKGSLQTSGENVMHFHASKRAVGRVYDPRQHLEYMGAEIVYGTAAMKESGMWVQEAGLVVLRPGLSKRLERCVLAHEAVHCEYGDYALPPGPEYDRRECRTNMIAAMRLIPCVAWKSVQHCGLREVCERLNVVPGIVEAYARCAERPWEVFAGVKAA